MSITDELRAYARGCDGIEAMKNELGFSTVGMGLNTIADRIDTEHEKALSEQFESLTYGMEPMTDENMAKDGWVRLPVDVDGVPINVGDETYHISIGPSGHRPVNFMILDKNGWTIEGEDKPSDILHWKQPAIEATLQELLEKAVGRDIAHTTAVQNTITEYAERIKEMFGNA